MIIKLLTSFSLVVLFSVTSFAGGDRQGGGGWMSAMNLQSAPSKMDYVKSMGINEAGQLRFKFKGFDSELVQVHAVDAMDLDAKYINALKKSEQTDHWEAVPVNAE